MIKKLVLTLSLLALLATPAQALAYDFFGGVCSDSHSASSSSVACQSQPKQANGKPVDPLTGPDGLIAHITNIVAYAAGAGAIIIIIIGALRFITSGSDVSTGSRTDTDVEDARRAIANAIIGLVVIIMARTIVIYVVSKF